MKMIKLVKEDYYGIGNDTSKRRWNDEWISRRVGAQFTLFLLGGL